MPNKFIIVVGGVYSGTGKGISAASLGLLLKMRGEKVQLIKCDPYYNANAGTMNPRQHGEVFLCNDGSETDLDLGHYERITGIEMSRRNIVTSGTINKELIEAEERGEYLGETVQVTPHVTNLIIKHVTELGKDSDIVIAEIGGTVGDMESESFYEAMRQLKQSNPEDVLVIMVAPIVWNKTVQEYKTKPLQNAVKTLLSKGLQPEILLCRIDLAPIPPNQDGIRICPPKLLDKIACMTNVHRNAIFEAPDVNTIYQVPIEFWRRHVDDLIADKFKLKRVGCRIHKYKDIVEDYLNGKDCPCVLLGIVGKYENCDEAYHSLKEAITHAAVANHSRFEIRWINSEELEETKDKRSWWRHFEGVHGVIVPGGFDIRGVEGKVRAIEYLREKKIPFLGICLGLQCAVIEFARNVMGLDGATSEEFNATAKHKVIHLLPDQKMVTKKSATMRLGSYDCILEKNTLAHGLYKKLTIQERHRHRFEVNSEYIDQFRAKGLIVSGTHPKANLVEFMELSQDQHPFYIGTQSHPEFRSRLGEPSPLFDGLIRAAITRIRSDQTETKT